MEPVEPTMEVFTESELIVLLIFGFLALLLVFLLVVVAVYCCNPARRKKWMQNRKTDGVQFSFLSLQLLTFIYSSVKARD